MEQTNSFLQLFEKYPELMYITGGVLLLSLSAFAYLLYDYLRRLKASKHKAKQINEPRLTKPQDSNKRDQVIINKPEPAVQTTGDSGGPKKEPVPAAPPARSAMDHTATTHPPRPQYQPVPETKQPEPTAVEPENPIDTKASQSGTQEEIRQPTELKPATTVPDTTTTERKELKTTTTPPNGIAYIPPGQHNPPSRVQAGDDAKSSAVIRIGYQPVDDWSQPQPWSYPCVLMPRPRSVVRLPHRQRRQLRGYTEASFQEQLSLAFHHCVVAGDCCVPTSAGSRPYEPDIALIIAEGTHNLFVDIEIDEPYAALKRTPMHCVGQDDARDAWFTDRGWLVIRFSERQISAQPERCLAFIGKVIGSVHPSFTIPAHLCNLPAPDREPQWTALDAQKLEQVRYRESYLGITGFGQVHLQDTQTAVSLNEQDLATEQLVEATLPGEVDTPVGYTLNVQNQHPRDRRIQFIRDCHLYLVDGVPVDSVTTRIDSCFPVFDEQYHAKRKAVYAGCSPEEFLNKWAAEGSEAQQLGNMLHESIEKYYHGVPFDPAPEFHYFRRFQADHAHLQPYRTEWRIFDEQQLIAGTVDLVTSNADGTFDIYDWKRSKKVIDPNSGLPLTIDPYGKKGVGLFGTISDTSYNRYCLQQNVYRFILEKHYQIRIRNMYLVVMHPQLSNYAKVSVPLMTDHAQLIISKSH